VLYLKAYKNYKPNYTPTQGGFNHFAFNVSISFLLGWSFYLCFLTLFQFLDIFNEVITLKTLDYIAFVSHIIICCKIILLIAYMNDIFYCFIALMFQSGIALELHHFKDNNYILLVIFMIFTSLSFTYSLLFSKEKNNTGEDKDVIENYNTNLKSGCA